ncbi:CPW-WPC family protein [Plasmodium gallinaceum]|uniref:CPW-WPC family protein n=1 Tax=Plasmodium gallinaceum TaxID=5849 RepID=A0A1J1GWW4_PLAGA|nr:CPW-WPC family protein [Plasmodium gallinaceum]CRG95797.1 CPW-WPC family protein [Plasmodium gallinaceum]
MFQNFLFFILFLIIKEAISQKNSTCLRDYSQNCAEGWSKLSKSKECVAPLSYRGPCPRFLQIEHETKKKKELEKLCNIYWPCLTYCEKNYSSECPEKWVQGDDKNCYPLATYEGTCLFSYDFSNMTDEQKEIWSNKCETMWPCKEKCKKDYSKLCPQKWIKDDNDLCSAPINYNGPCLSRASLVTLDKDMKVAFEKLCKLDYPCLKECKIDMDDPCPQNWILKSNESGTSISCLPPDEYKGICDENTKFIGLNLELKESIEYECDIKWPCAEEIPDLINYEELCPENWIQSENYCVAPQNYMGPCSKKKLFKSFRKEIKKAYAEECNIKWPLFKNSKENFPKISALRKGRYKFGIVEPITGEILSKIKK